MKNLVLLSKSLLLFVIMALGSCQKEKCEPARISNSLEGTWQLTKRQCFCAPGPVPNETVTFTATGFEFRINGQVNTTGTYAITPTVQTCGATSTQPGLLLTYSPGTRTPQSVAYTLTGNSLVLDFGGPCDAPVNTYGRLL